MDVETTIEGLFGYIRSRSMLTQFCQAKPELAEEWIKGRITQ